MFSQSNKISIREIKDICLSAEEGDAKAQFQLGFLYLIGHDDLAPSLEKAIHFFTLAADQGHIDAKDNLRRVCHMQLDFMYEQYLKKRSQENYDEIYDKMIKYFKNTIKNPSLLKWILDECNCKKYLSYEEIENEVETKEKKAAEILFDMGIKFFTGQNDFPRDLKQAANFILLAADQGHYKANLIFVTLCSMQLDFMYEQYLKKGKEEDYNKIYEDMMRGFKKTIKNPRLLASIIKECTCIRRLSNKEIKKQQIEVKEKMDTKKVEVEAQEQKKKNEFLKKLAEYNKLLEEHGFPLYDGSEFESKSVKKLSEYVSNIDQMTQSLKESIIAYENSKDKFTKQYNLYKQHPLYKILYKQCDHALTKYARIYKNNQKDNIKIDRHDFWKLVTYLGINPADTNNPYFMESRVKWGYDQEVRREQNAQKERFDIFAQKIKEKTDKLTASIDKFTREIESETLALNEYKLGKGENFKKFKKFQTAIDDFLKKLDELLSENVKKEKEKKQTKKRQVLKIIINQKKALPTIVNDQSVKTTVGDSNASLTQPNEEKKLQPVVSHPAGLSEQQEESKPESKISRSALPTQGSSPLPLALKSPQQQSPNNFSLSILSAPPPSSPFFPPPPLPPLSSLPLRSSIYPTNFSLLPRPLSYAPYPFWPSSDTSFLSQPSRQLVEQAPSRKNKFRLPFVNTSALKPRLADILSDHTPQILTYRLTEEKKGHVNMVTELTTGTFNTEDFGFSNKENGKYSNNPWNIGETFNEYLLRKERQLITIFRIIVNNSIDVMFLQEVDFLYLEEKYELTEEQSKKIIEIRTRFIISLQQKGLILDFSKLSDKQQPLAIIYRGSKLEYVHSYGVLEETSGARRYRGYAWIMHIGNSSRYIALVNHHLSFAEKNYSQSINALMQSFIDRNIAFLGAGDMNHTSGLKDDEIMHLFTPAVFGSGGSTNIQALNGGLSVSDDQGRNKHIDGFLAASGKECKVWIRFKVCYIFVKEGLEEITIRKIPDVLHTRYWSSEVGKPCVPSEGTVSKKADEKQAQKSNTQPDISHISYLNRK